MVFVKVFYCFLLSILSFSLKFIYLFFFMAFNLDRILMFLTLGRLYYIFLSTFMNYLYLFCLSILLLGLPFSFLFFFKMNVFLIRFFGVFILFLLPVIWSLNLGSLYNLNFRHLFFYLIFLII